MFVRCGVGGGGVCELVRGRVEDSVGAWGGGLRGETRAESDSMGRWDVR